MPNLNPPEAFVIQQLKIESQISSIIVNFVIRLLTDSFLAFNIQTDMTNTEKDVLLTNQIFKSKGKTTIF